MAPTPSSSRKVDADLYAQAKYGVLRVDADGDSVLVGLAGPDHNMLNPH